MTTTLAHTIKQVHQNQLSKNGHKIIVIPLKYIIDIFILLVNSSHVVKIIFMS